MSVPLHRCGTRPRAPMELSGRWLLLPWLSIFLFVPGSVPKQAVDTRETSPSTIRFVEVAPTAGVVAPDVWGGVDRKRFILETKGNGVAFLDYDEDGWLDVYLTNGSRIEGFPTGQEPTGHLFHNNRDGTFTDVTASSGLAHPGWQTGVCVGDFDNDGHEDILLTYWGQNRLYHNNGDGTFTDVTVRAGLKQSRTRWGAGSI